MLREIFIQLNEWVDQENKEATEEGRLSMSCAEIYIIGQSALMEAGLSIDLAATADVDSKYQLEYKLRKKFDELLKADGKFLDPVGHEAWMPEETVYKQIFEGRHIVGYIAEPVFIILSKAKKAPIKNKQLIIDYLASSDLDHRLFELAKKYDVKFEDII